MVRPQNARGVFLNEDLNFHFDAELDRASVTAESVRIVSRTGRSARGTWAVLGARLQFTPKPVLSPALDDGGYEPNTEYEVILAGFPDPSALRSVNSEPLGQTLRWSFSTVAVSVPRAKFVFDDRAPDRPPPLQLLAAAITAGNYVIAPSDSVYFVCEKPIDPSTLRDEDFWLKEPTRPNVADVRVPVKLRLVENEEEARTRPRPRGVQASVPDSLWNREKRAALLELAPVRRLTAPLYQIIYSPVGRGPCDFSGHSVADRGTAWKAIRLGATETGAFGETFLDPRSRSPVAVPGADGTAAWSESGRLEVRWPLAAGTGAAGAVALSAREDRVDLNATRLRLEVGASCALTSAPGLVILRAQTSLTLRGRLTRSVGSAHTTALPPDLVPAQGREPEASRKFLSDWLALVRSSGTDFTVLVAGGDIVIEKEAVLALDTPLLLCAGGVVRVAGHVRGLENFVYVLGDGGGPGIDPSATSANRLAIDIPNAANPLQTPLHLAILSGPLPSRGRVQRWLSGEAHGSPIAPSKPASRWSIRYLRELAAPPRSPLDLVTVDSPRLLDDTQAIQVLLELWMEPGGIWSPPFIDDFRLTWEPRGEAR